MVLVTQIKVQSQSRDGRQIKVKDATGLESAGRLNGYGATNGTPESILSHRFVVSRIFNSISYSLKIDGSDPLLPTNVQLANGQELTLTTGLFKTETDKGYEEPCEIFQDGILDINMYVEFAGLTGVVIEKGKNYISGGNFKEALKADCVIVNDKIYTINKSEDYAQMGYQFLFITGVFSEDATAFTVAYQANTKALLLAVSDNISSYACKQLRTHDESPAWQKIHAALAFREAARSMFNAEVPDLYAVEEMVEANLKLLNTFVC